MNEKNVIKTYIVYLHRNKINNKTYVGITSTDIKQRWRNGAGYSECPYFYRAINKYGWDAFEHRVLFDGLTQFDAQLIEVDLIYYFRKNNKSYNILDGGNLGWEGKQFSEEHRKKISNALLGNKNTQGYRCSEATKQKISEKNKGRKRSEIELENIRKAASKRDNSSIIEWNKKNKTKSVDKFDLNGNWLDSYSSIKEAAMQNSVRPDTLSHHLNGRGKTCGGFIWKVS